MTKMGQTKKLKKVIPVRYHDGLPQLRANAAGIDIGASEIWVDVGNKDAEPVRIFETFTADLNRMGDWLKSAAVLRMSWRWSVRSRPYERGASKRTPAEVYLANIVIAFFQEGALGRLSFRRNG
jgi:hypothetical protein